MHTRMNIVIQGYVADTITLSITSLLRHIAVLLYPSPITN